MSKKSDAHRMFALFGGHRFKTTSNQTGPLKAAGHAQRLVKERR